MEDSRIHDEGGMEESVPDFATEDDFRRTQKVNSVASIASLRMKPHCISRLRIPLCCLAEMPMVRLTLQSDIARLQEDFVIGYRDGSAVFYVSVTNEQGEKEDVTEYDKQAWGPLWNEVNDQFNESLRATPGLEHLQNAKFFVCDGNHRLLAWSSYISKHHNHDVDWHILVDSIILETKGRIGDVMHAMHDVNK